MNKIYYLIIINLKIINLIYFSPINPPSKKILQHFSNMPDYIVELLTLSKEFFCFDNICYNVFAFIEVHWFSIFNYFIWYVCKPTNYFLII